MHQREMWATQIKASEANTGVVEQNQPTETTAATTAKGNIQEESINRLRGVALEMLTPHLPAQPLPCPKPHRSVNVPTPEIQDMRRCSYPKGKVRPEGASCRRGPRRPLDGVCLFCADLVSSKAFLRLWRALTSALEPSGVESLTCEEHGHGGMYIFVNIRDFWLCVQNQYCPTTSFILTQGKSLRIFSIRSFSFLMMP